MAKIKIPIPGTIGKSVVFDSDATVGATVGVDLKLADGSIPTLAELLAAGLTPEAAILYFNQIAGEIADSQVPESAVVQHEAALTIAASQITGGLPANMIVNLSSPAGNTILTNSPNALRNLQNIDRYIAPVDLSDFTQVRFTGRVTTASASANTPEIILKYHTTFNTNIGTAADLVSGEIVMSLASLAYVDTGFVNLVAGAKASIWIMPGEQGGDGAADPRFSNLKVQFK